MSKNQNLLQYLNIGECIAFESKRTHQQGWATEERKTTAASWKWYRMMDDTLRPKHHINPPAQRDSHKVTAAVSLSPQVLARRQADCEEEDTLVMKHGESSWYLQEMEWREEKWERRLPEREEQERNIRERAEWATGPLENE